MAAIIAQKKLFKRSDTAESAVPSHIPSPHDLRGEEIRNFLQTEQDTADGRTERNCNTSSGSGTQYLTPFTCTLRLEHAPQDKR